MKFFWILPLVLGTTNAHSEKLSELGPACLSFYLKALTERTHESLVSNLRDIDDLLSYGIEKGDPSFSLRRKLVAMAKNPELREGLRAAIYTDLYAKSNRILNALEKAIEKNSIDEAAQVYDVISVGSGPHDAIALREIQQINPILKVVTLEAGDRVGATFDKEGFNVNSLNRKGLKDAPAQKGVGNQNELSGGLVQIPDIEASAYPQAQQLADVTLLNRATVKDAPVIFNTEIVRVEERTTENWPARYRVSTNRGEFYSNHIVNNTGLGRELKLPESIPVANRAMLYAERTGSGTAVGKAAKVQSVADYFDHLRNNKDGFKDYANEEIAIIGSGDSSNTLIESLLGLGPKDSYGNATAQSGRLKRAFWIGQDKEDCEALLNGLRQRYNDVIGGVKAGIILPEPRKLFNVEKLANGRFRVYSGMKGNVVYSDVDRVIFGTGFVDESAKIYESLLAQDARGFEKKIAPFNEVGYLEGQNGSIPGAQSTTIGKSLVTMSLDQGRTYHGIHFNGPSAGKIVNSDELRNVSENAASLFNTGPRNKAFMKRIFQKEQAGNFTRMATGDPVPLQTVSGPKLAFEMSSDFGREVRAPIGVDDVTAKALLLSALEDFRGEKANPIEIKISRLKSGKNKFVLSTNPPLSEEAHAKLAEVIQASPYTMRSVEQMAGELSANNTIEMKLVFQKNGKLNPVYTDVRFTRAPPIENFDRILKTADTRPKAAPYRMSSTNPIRILKDFPSLRRTVDELSAIEKPSQEEALRLINKSVPGPERDLTAYLLTDRIENLDATTIEKIAEGFPKGPKRDDYIISAISKLKVIPAYDAKMLLKLVDKEQNLVGIKVARRIQNLSADEAKTLESLVTSREARETIVNQIGLNPGRADGIELKELLAFKAKNQNKISEVFRKMNDYVDSVRNPDEFLSLIEIEATDQTPAYEIKNDLFIRENLAKFSALKTKPTANDYSLLSKFASTPETAYLIKKAEIRAGETVSDAKNTVYTASLLTSLGPEKVDQLVLETLPRLKKLGAESDDYRVLINSMQSPEAIEKVLDVALQTSKKGIDFQSAVLGAFGKAPQSMALNAAVRRSVLANADKLFEGEYTIDQVIQSLQLRGRFSNDLEVLKLIRKTFPKLKTEKQLLDLVGETPKFASKDYATEESLIRRDGNIAIRENKNVLPDPQYQFSLGATKAELDKAQILTAAGIEISGVSQASLIAETPFSPNAQNYYDRLIQGTSNLQNTTQFLTALRQEYIAASNEKALGAIERSRVEDRFIEKNLPTFASLQASPLEYTFLEQRANSYQTALKIKKVALSIAKTPKDIAEVLQIPPAQYANNEYFTVLTELIEESLPKLKLGKASSQDYLKILGLSRSQGLNEKLLGKALEISESGTDFADASVKASTSYEAKKEFVSPLVQKNIARFFSKEFTFQQLETVRKTYMVVGKEMDLIPYLEKTIPKVKSISDIEILVRAGKANPSPEFQEALKRIELQARGVLGISPRSNVNC
jgi:hypothetical protein